MCIKMTYNIPHSYKNISQHQMANFNSAKLQLLLHQLVAQRVKHRLAVRETRVWSLGQEDRLEKEMATQSGTLAWKIPWTEKPGRLQSMGLQRVGHNWATSLSLSFNRLVILWPKICTMVESFKRCLWSKLREELNLSGKSEDGVTEELGLDIRRVRKSPKKKWRWGSESDSWSVVSDSLWPVDYTVHGILQARDVRRGWIPSEEKTLCKGRGVCSKTGEILSADRPWARKRI